jgi:hypothetical protein
MKTNNKDFTTWTRRIILTVAILFFATPALALTIDRDTQQLINQRMKDKITQNVEQGFANEAIFLNMQDSMMAIMSETIKKNTAARKRATVVQTCMECRVGKPLKIEVTGKTAILDMDTQAIINQKMAAMVEETMRKISSTPAVALSVQKKMMNERMKDNILRIKLQPYMMGMIFGSSEGHFVQKKEVDSIAQNNESGLQLVTMQKD